MHVWRILACVTALIAIGEARAANPEVVVDTSFGKFTLELFEDKAPITVKNFLQYVDDKHYDGLIFHRVKPDSMIQGGGFTPGMNERKVRDPIKNESSNGLKNLRGTIAMPRAKNQPDSATSQFYVNVVDNPTLDKAAGGYCVFGRVLDGIDVVDKIRKVETVELDRKSVV